MDRDRHRSSAKITTVNGDFNAAQEVDIKNNFVTDTTKPLEILNSGCPIMKQNLSVYKHDKSVIF